MPALAPTYRPDKYAKLDRRTWESRLLAEVRRDLTAHCGGKPSVTQRALIDRAARLSLYVAQMDQRMAHGWTEYDSRTYLAWSNSLARTLAKIGLKAAPERPIPFHERLAARESAQRAGAS